MDIFKTDIIPVQPYNFGLALAYLRTSPSTVLEHIEGMQYARALSIKGIDVVVHITHDGPIDQTILHIEIVGQRITDEVAQDTLSTIHRMFNLDENPGEFHKLSTLDPILGRLLQSYRGLRPTLIADPYECLLWAIMGQQVTVKFARKVKLAFMDLFGRKVLGDTDYWLVPHPEDVAIFSEDLLGRIQLSRQKARAIIAVSDAIASGDLNLLGLREMGYDEACSRLMQFKGVGRWTAEYVLMRGLGFKDVIPAADIGLQSSLGKTYGLRRKATETEVREIAERWRPWRGWAAFFWWFQLQTEEFVKQVTNSQKGGLV